MTIKITFIMCILLLFFHSMVIYFNHAGKNSSFHSNYAYNYIIVICLLISLTFSFSAYFLDNRHNGALMNVYLRFPTFLIFLQLFIVCIKRRGNLIFKLTRTKEGVFRGYMQISAIATILFVSSFYIYIIYFVF